MNHVAPESWACIDCGINTAPGFANLAQIETAFSVLSMVRGGIKQTVNERSEIYMVKHSVWKAAGMDDFGGCLCIGCLEKRIGRTLVPKDFQRNHPFNLDDLPCTRRLRARREGLKEWVEKQLDGSYQLCRVGSNGEVTNVPVED